jgi:hypothetical protein
MRYCENVQSSSQSLRDPVPKNVQILALDLPRPETQNIRVHSRLFAVEKLFLAFIRGFNNGEGGFV